MPSWASGSPAAWLCLLHERGDGARVWVEGREHSEGLKGISSISDNNYLCRRLQLCRTILLERQLDPTAGKPRGEFLIRSTSTPA